MAPFSWTFTTAADTTPPVVTATSPAANATNVGLSSVVTATFGEAVQSSTISFVLKDASNNTVSGSVTYDPVTETVTLSPTSSLGYSTVYTATLSGAQDLAGNVMAPFSWSFTTAADTTPPVVTSTSPAANATGVVIDSVVTATFSEAVQASTISFVLKDASNNTVPATVSYDASSHTATLTPNSALTAMASYTATLSGAEELAGNGANRTHLVVVHNRCHDLEQCGPRLPLPLPPTPMRSRLG